MNKFYSLSRSFNVVPTLTTNLCFPISAITSCFWFCFILFYLCYCLCFLVFLTLTLTSSLSLQRWFFEAENTANHIENLQFFFPNVATAVAVGDGGRWRFGKFTFNWVLFGGMVMRGRKVLCKLIWLNAKIGHALKKDESEMKCCPPSQCVYTLGREIECYDRMGGVFCERKNRNELWKFSKWSHNSFW